jgi:hypothetical protein
MKLGGARDNLHVLLLGPKLQRGGVPRQGAYDFEYEASWQHRGASLEYFGGQRYPQTNLHICSQQRCLSILRGDHHA